jgi:hypothetical protein
MCGSSDTFPIAQEVESHFQPTASLNLLAFNLLFEFRRRH